MIEVEQGGDAAMQHSVNEIIEQLSVSHQQLNRLMEAKRHIAVRMSQIVGALPDQHPEFDGLSGLMNNSRLVTKSVVAYLNSLGDLQETISDHLSYIMKGLDDHDEE